MIVSNFSPTLGADHCTGVQGGKQVGGPGVRRRERYRDKLEEGK